MARPSVFTSSGGALRAFSSERHPFAYKLGHYNSLMAAAPLFFFFLGRGTYTCTSSTSSTSCTLNDWASDETTSIFELYFQEVLFCLLSSISFVLCQISASMAMVRELVLVGLTDTTVAFSLDRRDGEPMTASSMSCMKD